MGMAASQARFLELTARRGNIEYQAQQINFERIQLANKSSDASLKYNEKMSNKKLTFTFNDGEGRNSVDVTYNNYKNYMNQQMDGINSSSAQLFLLSSSGNKIIVSNEEEIQEMMSRNEGKFTESDFMIAPDLDDIENFQQAIRDGIYTFGTYEKDDTTGEGRFVTSPWDSIQTGAIQEVYDTSDDQIAEAEYQRIEADIQLKDKKLALELDKLEEERQAVNTEMEAVKKVIEDDVESSYKTFG